VNLIHGRNKKKRKSGPSFFPWTHDASSALPAGLAIFTTGKLLLRQASHPIFRKQLRVVTIEQSQNAHHYYCQVPFLRLFTT
jgi:hypothetical protein